MKKIILIHFFFLLFIGSFASDRYWVGGSGNWSDVAHWSVSDGGQGGAAVPDLSNNVFFTAKSFSNADQIVTVDVPAVCSSMSWKGVLHAPQLLSDATVTLSLYGSLKLDAAMQFNVQGDIYFKTPNNVGSTLYTSGHTILGNIYIDAPNGTVVLGEDLKTSTTSIIAILNGTFNSNDKNIYTGSIVTKGTQIRSVLLGKSTITLDKWQFIENTNLTLNALQASIVFRNGIKSGSFQTAHSMQYGQVIVPKQQSACSLTLTQLNPIQCFGDSTDVAATIVGAGCTGPYSFQWDDPLFQTNDTASNLAAGTYVCVVTDISTGTQFGNSIPITSPAKLQVFTSTTSVSCNGGSDGTATVTLSLGGTGAYTYAWSAGAIGSTTKATGLSQGTYTVTISDANNCTGTKTFTITQPPAMASNGTITNVNCFGLCTGTVGVKPTGGTIPYTYLWNTGSTAATISALCAATYTLTLSDSKGCTVLYTPTVAQPASPLLASAVSANVSCAGKCDGSTVLTASGGTAAYTYLWSNAATASILGSLCAASYSCTVTDANGCTKIATTNITEPTALNAAPTGTNITCFGNANGTVAANASGGTVAYTYSWSPGGATTPTVGSLGPNTYTVTVTDSKGCTTTSTVVITEPGVLAANVVGTNISCSGLCNGTATASPTGGTTAYTYSWSPGGAITATISALCVNTYTVTVTDANGCSTTSTASVTQPSVLSVSNASTNVSCNGACDGTATASITGGTTSYTYLWSNAGTVNKITALCAASYTVTVTDANGCTATSSSTITQPSAVSATTSVTPVSCSAGCNGTATVSASGGSAPYVQAWSTSATSAIVSGLCAATYTVTVTDANGCTATSTAVITQPAALALSLTPTNVTCFGLCTGSASGSPSGGTSPYTYLWNNSATGQTTSGLCANNYTLTVTDANGCTSTSTTAITAPAVLSATIISSNVSCNGGCDGSATANPGGGTAPYTYSWSNSSAAQTASALCIATYTVTVTDANGCQTTQTVTITQPSALNASLASSTASCGLCNGTTTANPSGGTSAYTYLWSDAQTTQTASSLCVGTYTVTVTDSKACTATGTIAVSAAVNIVVTASPSSLNCFGVCDGVATANASNGTLPYTFSWSSGQSTANATNLCAGTYTVTATDAAGCTNTATTNFVNPAVIDPSVSKTDITCNSACDGTATSAPSGGSGPYTYSWSTGSTAATITSLCAATYTITVTDSKACTITTTVTITEPSALSDNNTITQATCSVCDGQISVAPTGGSAAYTYVWSTGSTAATITNLCVATYTLTLSSGGTCQSIFTYAVSNTTGPTLTKTRTNALCNGVCNGSANVVAAGSSPFTYSWTSGSTSATANSLCAGTYTLSVTDNNTCVTVDTLLIKQPSKISPNETSADVTCGGVGDGAIILVPSGGTPSYTYSWSNGATTSIITNLTPGPYTFTVTDANGCDSINTITITEPAVLSANVAASTDVTCKGACDGSAFAMGFGGTSPYTYSWSNGDVLSITINLCPNTYTVTVTDINGCTATSTVTIVEPAAALSGLVSQTNVSCNAGSDGTAFINASGGTSPYAYTWNPGGATSATASSLFAGTYNVTVTDANGCTTIGTATITEPTTISFTTVQVDAGCNTLCNGSLTVTASGGTSPFNYLWSNAVTGATTTGLCAGGYTVTATDNNGCTNSKNYTITEPAILLPNVTGTDPNCTGLTTGSAVSNPSGGTAPFTYSWSNGTSSQTNTSLTAGIYTVTVTDKNSCNNTQSVTLLPATSITVVQAVSDASCSSCNGTISVAPSGGTPAYTYTWNTGSSTSSISALCAANYTLTVTDVNGCTGTFTIPVNNTGGPTGEIVNVTNDSCNAACNGTAIVTPIGGTLPYTYLWTDIANTNNSRAAMCAGSYTLQVTDANACIRNSPVTITEPAPFNISPTITDVSCSGKCDGAITLTSTGGTAPYTYTWNTGATGATQTSLCAGTYIVTLTDANLCSTTDTVVVGVLLPLSASVTQSNPLCNGMCTGTANISMSGGTNPYTFSWSNGTAASSSSSLCANTYTVSVNDAVGCNITQTVNITEPLVLGATPTTITATCGVCNGQIGITPSGGSGAYTYTWGTGSTAQTISSLCAGVYALNISDANGCTQPFNIPLNNTNGPSASTIVKTDLSCFGANDGTATVSPNGGTPAYTYLWIATGQTTNAVTGLPGGVNLIQITDAIGCIRTDTVNIGSPTQINPNQSVTNASCGASDGQISVNPTGGVIPYTYLWSTGATTNTITGLAPANYTITITDATGCTQTAIIPLSNNNAPVVTTGVQNVSCNGSCNGIAGITITGGQTPYSILWSNALTTDTISGLCPGTYDVTVTDFNGCITISNINITEPTLLTLTAPSSQQVTCSAVCNGTAAALPTGGTLPYTYSWSNGSTATTVSSLCAGTYAVTCTDAMGCTSSQTITIIPNPTPFTVVTNVTAATCGQCNGVASVTVSGGAVPYTYLWSNSATGATISSLCAAVYSIDIKDSSGCSSSFLLPVSNAGAPSSSGKSITNILCNGVCSGGATLSPVGGTAPYTYLWLPGGQTTTSISNQCAGMGFVQITDANGCTLTDTINITEPAPFALNEVITPPSACAVNDGAITLNPSGGTPASYTYSWSGGLPANSSQAGLGAGLYALTVTDASACSLSTVVAINNSTAPVLSDSIMSNVSCAGKCDGAAVVKAIGGTQPFTYSWNDPSSTVIDTVKGLCFGTYFVQVSDAAGCIVNSSITITEPNTLMMSTPITQVASCADACNGTAMVLPAGGVLPYIYQWSTSATTASTANLCVGTYTVSVTDANACTTTQTITIAPSPTPFTITPVVTNASCGQCNGTASVTVNGGFSPYTYLWSNAVTGATASSLCASVYSIDIKDSAGCAQSFFVPVSNSSGPTASGKIITNISCNGQCNGGASVSPVGGTAPYTYLWLPGGQTSQSISNQCAGLGFVQITDANGCTLTDTINITEPAPFVVNAVVTPPSACTVNDGSVTINPSGGTAPYTYTWGGAMPATNVQTNLGAGLYVVTITDAASCAQSTVVTINNIVAPAVTVSLINNASCSNKCDAKAVVNATGGTLPYTYSWNDPSSSTIDTAKALCAGTYFVQVEDAAGCIISSSTTITEPLQLLLSSPVTNDASCSAVCNGTATALPAGGTLPYSFLWSTSEATSSVDSLCAATYTVSVSDANGCQNIQTLAISANPNPIVITTAVTKAVCGVCNGQIAVTVVGGNTPHTYLWSNNDTLASVAGLCAGVQSVDITDAVGCKTSFNIPMSNLGGPTSSGKIITDATCFGLCNGSATVSPVGGTLPYTYAWTNAATGQTASNLCPGLMFVQIADSSGCILTDSILIGSPTQLIISAASTPPSSCNVSDGTVSINVTGGAGTYTYSWSNTPVDTASQSNLGAGAYMLTVTDASGCTQSTAVTINNINAPIVSNTVADATCFGKCDGWAAVSASAGTPPYTYSWNNSPSSVIDTASALCAGNYVVQVTDNNGCIVTAPVTVKEPSLLSMSISNTVKGKCVGSCDGNITALPLGGTLPYLFSWSGTAATTAFADSLCAGKYTFTVTDAQGCTVQHTDSILSPDSISVSKTLVSANCNSTNDGSVTITVAGGKPGYTYSWSGPGTFSSTAQNIANLYSGKYPVTITDANGCTKLDTAVVSAITNVVASAGKDTSFCQGASVVLDASKTLSAVTYKWFQLPVMTKISDSIVTTVTPPTGTTNYLLVAVNGACSDTDTVAIVANATPIVSAGTGQTIFPLQSITIGGSPTTTASGATYSWKPAADLTDSLAANPDATPLATTLYTVVVRDANGCSASDTVRITVVPEIIFTNGITPNGDGKNETWIIDNIYKFPKCLVEIYNRWGDQIFTSVGYGTPWDGKYKGKDLPVGTYYYVIKLNDPLYPTPYTGPITILR